MSNALRQLPLAPDAKLKFLADKALDTVQLSKTTHFNKLQQTNGIAETLHRHLYTYYDI